MATRVHGYAVCHGCILVSLGTEFWVFHIATKTWHPVEFSKKEDSCTPFTFNGRAVIVDDTIYGLSSIWFATVVSFSFRIHSEDDGRTIYSLEKPYLSHLFGDRCGWHYVHSLQKEYLVPLGKLQFCYVQTYSDCELSITTFEIVRGGDGRTMEIKTLHSTHRAVDFGAISEDCGEFLINFAYSLECGDFEPGGEVLMEKRNAKKKRRNRNKKKNFNWDSEDSECEFLDPNSLLPEHMERQGKICNRNKRKRKGKMNDVKFLGSYTGDVIQSVKVTDSIVPECEDSVPGGQEACQLKKKWNAKKKKRNRNKKMNFNLDTQDSKAKFLDPNSSLPLVKYNESQGKMMDAKFPDLNTGDVIQSVKKKRNRIKKKKYNLYTKDSGADYLDPISSLPLVKYNESQGEMMDAKFPDPHTGDVIESVKVIDSIVLDTEDSETKSLDPNSSLPPIKYNESQRKRMNAKFSDPNTGDVIQSVKKKRNRNKKKNFNLDTEESETKFLDPNSSLPPIKYNESQGKMMDAKFMDPTTGDVIQSVKKKRNQTKKKNSNLPVSLSLCIGFIAIASTLLVTEDSEAKSLDPNSCLPPVKYNESQGKMMDAKFPDPNTGDVIQSVKVIDSIVLECEDSVPKGQDACQLKKKRNAKKEIRNSKKINLNRALEDVAPKEKETCEIARKKDTSTERSKLSSGGLSENSSSSSQSQVVKSGSQAAGRNWTKLVTLSSGLHWFVWSRIMDVLSSFLQLLEEIGYLISGPSEYERYESLLREKLLLREKQLLGISENSSSSSHSQVVTEPCGRCTCCKSSKEKRLGRSIEQDT